MSAAGVIDSLEFARAEQQMRGSLPVAGLKRLEDVLFDSEGALAFELRGTRDGRNRAQLELQIEGPLHLQCQRCLGRLDHDLLVANTLLVVPSGTPTEADIEDPEAPDVLEGDPELDVAQLIEDEVLLSLPLAPRHPDGACESRIPHGRDALHGSSPFSQLAALKRPRNNR